MPAQRVLKLCLLLCLLVGSLLACDANFSTNGSLATPVATTTSSQDTPLNQWLEGSSGVALRYEQWKSQGNNVDTVVIARFDLNRIHLTVSYQPAHPQALSEWIKHSGAIAMINGGYFDDHNQPAGLLISNGNATGTSYAGFGGMLSVNAQGHVSLRSLRDHPYDAASEQLQQATQSSPMLMLNGKRTQFNADSASQRRSIVAIDKQGHLLLIVSPGQAFSLDELADLLAASDLSIETALNLDGGASTGLYVNAGSQKASIDSFTALPIVISIT